MSSARILRPFARALQRPIARPTSYAAFSTKSAKVVAPSVTAQLQQAKTQQTSAKAVEPAQKMTKLVWNDCFEWADAELTVLLERPPGCHAPARPILLRQRDYHGLCSPPNPHLPFLQVPPPPESPSHGRPLVHQQTINESKNDGSNDAGWVFFMFRRVHIDRRI